MEIIADFGDRYVNEIPRLAHSENFGDIYFENFITGLVSPDGIINRILLKSITLVFKGT